MGKIILHTRNKNTGGDKKWISLRKIHVYRRFTPHIDVDITLLRQKLPLSKLCKAKFMAFGESAV